MTTTRRFTRVKTRWFYALMPYKGCEGIFALIFPLFLFNVLHMPVSTVGVLSALVSLGAVSGSIFWGYVSDHYHTRRAFIVMGCFLSGVCLMGIGWVTQLVWIALLCVAFGFFSIAPAPISSILIMETLSKTQWERSFGQFNRIGGWGWIAGLIVGIGALPVLQRWFAPEQSMRLTLWGLAAMMVGTAWWAAYTIPQPRRRVRRREFITVTHRLPTLSIVERVLYLPRRLLFVLRPAHVLRLRLIASSSPLWWYLAATLIMFVSFIMALTPFPLYLQETHGMGSTLIFTLILVRAIAPAPFYMLAGQWTARFGAHCIQTWALAARCVAMLSLSGLSWFSDSGLILGLLVSINIIIGLSWSVLAVAGPALVGRLAIPGREGEAMGLYNAVQGIGQILGAMLGGCLAYWVGYASTFAIAGMLLLPAMAILLRIGFQNTATPVEGRHPTRAAA